MLGLGIGLVLGLQLGLWLGLGLSVRGWASNSAFDTVTARSNVSERRPAEVQPIGSRPHLGRPIAAFALTSSLWRYST